MSEIFQTRLLSKAHQPRCVNLVTRGHFRSRDKDGGHTNRSGIAENPMLHANFTSSIHFIETELLPFEVLHCENNDFRPLLLL